MEVKKSNRQRRYHPEEFKQAVVESCCEPGVSVSGIALANGVNANQVRRWMRERGLTPPTRQEILATSAMPEFVPVAIPSEARPLPDIHLELRRGDATVVIRWPVGAAEECGAWLRAWLR
jgi:transposase